MHKKKPPPSEESGGRFFVQEGERLFLFYLKSRADHVIFEKGENSMVIVFYFLEIRKVEKEQIGVPGKVSADRSTKATLMLTTPGNI